jgi:hypothetical protein
MVAGGLLVSRLEYVHFVSAAESRGRGRISDGSRFGGSDVSDQRAVRAAQRTVWEPVKIESEFFALRLIREVS